MTLKIQIIVIAISILAIIITIFLIKKERLGLRIAMPWLVVFVLIILNAAVPPVMVWFSNLIGIYAPVNMVIFLGGIFVMMIIYSLTMTVYSNRKKLRDLVQKVAILEEELKRDKNSDKECGQ